MLVKCPIALAVLLAAMALEASAEFDPERAFEAHRELMVGGTWVSTDEDGEVEADRHIASKSKKFVQIVNVIGGTGFVGVYGIDPKSGDLTLWAFDHDDAGAVGIWVCKGYENGKWTWVSEHKGGPISGTAILTRVSKDEIRLRVEGEESAERVWRRRD